MLLFRCILLTCFIVYALEAKTIPTKDDVDEDDDYENVDYCDYFDEAQLKDTDCPRSRRPATAAGQQSHRPRKELNKEELKAAIVELFNTDKTKIKQKYEPKKIYKLLLELGKDFKSVNMTTDAATLIELGVIKAEKCNNEYARLVDDLSVKHRASILYDYLVYLRELQGRYCRKTLSTTTTTMIPDIVPPTSTVGPEVPVTSTVGPSGAGRRGKPKRGNTTHKHDSSSV